MYHLGQTPSRHDIAGMYEAIEMTGRLLYGFSHVIIAVEIKDIGDKVESILVILDFGI